MQASRCVCGSVPSSGDDLPGSCPPLLSELARLAGLPATSLHCKMRDSGLGAMFPLPLPEADRPSWQGAVTNKMARTAWALLAHGGTYRAPELAETA